MSGRLNPQQFGITPHEHVDLLRNAWKQYEPDQEWKDANFDYSAGQSERGHPYGPEDFKMAHIRTFDPGEESEGMTHEVHIERGDKGYRSIFGWNRETGEKSLWMD